MTKRREPWEEYPRVHGRLEQWGRWLRAKDDEHIGWNVYRGDQDPGLRVQMRNDVHTDRVFSEIAHLTHDDKRIWTTHSMLCELPGLWKRILVILYVDDPRASKSDVAHHVGIDHRDVSVHLWAMFRELESKSEGARYSASSAA